MADSSRADSVRADSVRADSVRAEAVLAGRASSSAGQAPLGLTPSQTVGPFLAIGLPWADGPEVVAAGTPGAITISGLVLDGAGEPVPDALIETWQAGPDGRFGHPDDPRGGGDPAFRGFGRSATDPAGRYVIVTLRPGAFPSADGGVEAPHLNVSVFARGLLDRVVTRIYFADEAAANEADPVLGSVDPARRGTLIAAAAAAAAAAADPVGWADRFRFDIRLQGADETVFFDV